MEMIDELNLMSIHEMKEIFIQGWCFQIVRVPNGWIYYRCDTNGGKMTSNFIPEVI